MLCAALKHNITKHVVYEKELETLLTGVSYVLSKRLLHTHKYKDTNKELHLAAFAIKNSVGRFWLLTFKC